MGGCLLAVGIILIILWLLGLVVLNLGFDDSDRGGGLWNFRLSQDPPIYFLPKR